MAKTPIIETFLDGSDAPARGYVMFSLAAAAYHEDENALFTRTPVLVNLDDDGTVAISLEPTSGADADWSVEGLSYLVEERMVRFDGRPIPRRRYFIDVPTSASPIKLGELSTYATAPVINGNQDLAAEWLAFLAEAGSSPLVTNVQDPAFGASGGGTVDDTAAFLAAIDSMQQAGNPLGGMGGGILYVPDGLYKVSASLLVGEVGEYVSGFRILGESVYGAVLQPTDDFGADPVVKFTNARKCEIANLGIHGNEDVNPRAAIEFHRDTPGISHNIVDNVAMGGIFEGDPLDMLVDGIRATCAVGQDGNNDVMRIQTPFISRFTGVGISFEGKESVQNLVDDATINHGATAIAFQGGSANVIGLIANELTDCEFDFQAPFSLGYKQATNIIACNTEYDGVLGATMIRTTDDEHIDIHVTNYTRMGSLANIDLIDYQSDGQLTFTNSNFYLGQVGQRVYFTDPTANIAVIGCTLAWTDIEYHSKLKMMGNGYRTTPTFVPLDNADLLNLDVAGGPWTDYTVTPAGTGVAKGNGTTFGRYNQAGKTVTFWAAFTLGTTSTMPSSGHFKFNLPVTGHNASVISLSARCTEAGVAEYLLSAKLTTTQAELYRISAADGTLNALGTTLPFTWGDGDSIIVSGTYEAA